ncbi:unnamed protein product [Ectocarpus sp. 12 AP-2014]
MDRLKSRKDSRVFADKWGPGMLALGLFAAIVTVFVMQVVEYIDATDTPSVSVAGVSDAVAHAQDYSYNGVVYTPMGVSRNAALVKLASELNSFSPSKAYEFSNLSNGRPIKRLRKREEYVVASVSSSDLASLPHREAVLVTAQEEVFMFPGANTGTFDVAMEFYNTASVDFVGPYATSTFTGDEETTVRLGVRCVSADGDSFSGTTGWRTAVEGANGTAPTPSSEITLNTYFENVGTALTTHLGTDSYQFTDAGTVYVWSSEFDLEIGGMDASLVWEVEYESEAEAFGTGDDVFDLNLPSTLSLEIAATRGRNFTTFGLAAAESFFMQVAAGGLTYVRGAECV